MVMTGSVIFQMFLELKNFFYRTNCRNQEDMCKTYQMCRKCEDDVQTLFCIYVAHRHASETKHMNVTCYSKCLYAFISWIILSIHW